MARRRREAIHFQIIPMIDVFMIITLFLTVMAFLPQITDALKAELPASNAAEKVPPSLVVQLLADGTVRVQNQTLAPAGLQDRLRIAVAEKPDLAVIVAADRTIAYERVVQLIDQIKASGCKRLALATAPGSATRNLTP